MRAVARLALPASDQLAYLASIGVGDLADELALDLDDYKASLQADLGLTPGELGRLEAIDGLLVELTEASDESLWRTRGLVEDERWERIRQLAREFLFMQGQ